MKAELRFDLFNPRFFAKQSKEGEYRELVFQARPSEGQFLTPSRFHISSLRPWGLYDGCIEYVEEGTVHIREDPSARGAIGRIFYLAPFEGWPRGSVELYVWVSWKTFQTLLDACPSQTDYHLAFAFAPKEQGVVESHYDEVTHRILVSWDTEAERAVLADEVTIGVAEKAPVAHEDDSAEEQMISEVATEPFSNHTELIAKLAELHTTGIWIVGLMSAILFALFFFRS